MGGNALKAIGVDPVRLSAKEYVALESQVFKQLLKICGWNTKAISTIPYYNEKSSFGDLDILVHHYEYRAVRNYIQTLGFKSVINGRVISIAWPISGRYFQVDLVIVNDIPAAKDYFAYNDLGGLLGNMVKALGFVYGHEGLRFKYRTKDGIWSLDKDTPKLEADLILVSGNRAKEILWDLLEIPLYFREKFLSSEINSLEDIYEFVASSPYCFPELYTLENLSNKDRIRDRKRSTYTGFLEYLSTNKITGKRQPNPYLGINKVNELIPEFSKRLGLLQMDLLRSRTTKDALSFMTIKELYPEASIEEIKQYLERVHSYVEYNYGGDVLKWKYSDKAKTIKEIIDDN